MAVKHFLFIRHGKTLGNLERRYLGDLREPLCEAGRLDAEALAETGDLPLIDALFTGPALRCRQTAEILFPDVNSLVCPLVEIDFGVFKGKNAAELSGDKDYAAWLQADCMSDIPGGDSVAAFKKRCCDTFGEVAKTTTMPMTALVIHGGNIMAILEHLARPRQNFHAYHIPNCGFILCRYENDALYIERKGGAL